MSEHFPLWCTVSKIWAETPNIVLSSPPPEVQDLQIRTSDGTKLWICLLAFTEVVVLCSLYAWMLSMFMLEMVPWGPSLVESPSVELPGTPRAARPRSFISHRKNYRILSRKLYFHLHTTHSDCFKMASLAESRSLLCEGNNHQTTNGIGNLREAVTNWLNLFSLRNVINYTGWSTSITFLLKHATNNTF